MREIPDKNRLERLFGEQSAHFRRRPPLLRLVEFERGEILNDPLKPLSRFYIIARGSVSIYNLTEDGSVPAAKRADGLHAEAVAAPLRQREAVAV